MQGIFVGQKGEHFKFDSSELQPPAKEILDSLANDLINDTQKTEVEANGYASSEGGVAYNQRLSERRARAVVEYLKAKGVKNKLIAKAVALAASQKNVKSVQNELHVTVDAASK